MVDGNQQIRRILAGERLACPSDLSPEIYTDILLACWEEEPDQRPSFTSLLTRLASQVGEERLAESREVESRYMSRLPLLYRDRQHTVSDGFNNGDSEYIQLSHMV